MTVSSTIRKAGPFTGNNLATTFPFSFKIFSKGDVKVLLVNTNGLTTVLTLDSDYSVQLNANQDSQPGGWVTYPISGNPLATGYELVMLGDLPYDQETDITNQGGFYPSVIEDMSDRSTIQIQQLAEITSRAIVYSEAESVSPVLPNAQARANSIVGFDASGNLELYGLSPTIGAGDLRNEAWTDGQDFTAGTSNSVLLSRAYGTKANLGTVVMSGVSQDPNSYSLANNGTVLQFDSIIPVGVTRIWCVGGTTLSIYVPPDGSVGDSKLAWSGILDRCVDTIAALRQLSKILYDRAFTLGYYALGDGGGGQYYLDATDTSSVDNGGTVIVAADGGRWKLRYSTFLSVLQFGAKGDGTADDQPAFQAAINALTTVGNPNGGASGTLFAPAGRSFTFKTAGITISSPINIDCRSIISYAPITGSAVTIGTAYAWSNAYDIYFAGFTSTTTGAFPAAINAAGCTAVKINAMTFSRFTVRTITGFSYAGVYLDGSGALGWQQIIQHNRMDLGQIANCGVGVKMVSADAATSQVEANRFFIQNVYQNYTNIQVDDATHVASGSNTFDINAMDNCSPGGVGLDMYALYNHVYIGYTAAPIRMNASSGYCYVKIQNTPSSGVVISYGGTNNWVQCDSVDAGQLPVGGVAIGLNTNYQNTYGVPIEVVTNVNLTPTSSSSESATVAVGPTAAALVTKHNPAISAMATPVAIQFPLQFIVPPGWYWKISGAGSGAIALGTAAFQQSSS